MWINCGLNKIKDIYWSPNLFFGDCSIRPLNLCYKTSVTASQYLALCLLTLLTFIGNIKRYISYNRFIQTWSLSKTDICTMHSHIQIYGIIQYNCSLFVVYLDLSRVPIRFLQSTCSLFRCCYYSSLTVGSLLLTNSVLFVFYVWAWHQKLLIVKI